jgi:transcription elongation factor GreA
MSGLIPMTPENFERLRAELESLQTTERRRIREDLAHAMSFGDFSENAELDEAKRAHSALEGRIAQLEKMISRAEVIDLTQSDQVSVGATVIAADLGTSEEICFLVGVGGHDDGDAIVVTPDSPVGRGLMGKCTQDEVEVETPMGKQRYKILSIEYPGICG